MTESSEDWASEDDEQLSQSLSQELTSSAVKKEESDDSWASEDDEKLSQELLSQESSQRDGISSSQLAAWVSPRIKLEEAMESARAASPTDWTDGSAARAAEDEEDSRSSGSDSDSDSEREDERDVHPLLRRCAKNELDLRLGNPDARTPALATPALAEDAHPTAALQLEDQGTLVIGVDWTEAERHRFFRALRRCGKQPHKISERVGTKTPIEVATYLQQLHAASVAHGAASGGAVDEGDGDSGSQSGSSTEDEAEAEDAGDCRNRRVRGYQPKRAKGRFPGGRCARWPACEGDKPLPSDLVWEQRGWEGLAQHELEALKVLGLNNLARYLGQKMSHHAFASYDSGAALELHAQLVVLLASVLSVAATRAAQRLKSRSGGAPAVRGKAEAAVITLADVASAAASVAPHRYSETLVRQWASRPLPRNPFGKLVYRPVTNRSAVFQQTRPATILIGNQTIIGPYTVLPSAPPSTAEMVRAEIRMRETEGLQQQQQQEGQEQEPAHSRGEGHSRSLRFSGRSSLGLWVEGLRSGWLHRRRSTWRARSSCSCIIRF